MASPMIGCRVPPEWYSQILEIQQATGQTPADICREAVGRYLGKAGTGNRTISRIDRLEQQVADLQQAAQRSAQAAEFLRALQQP